jgi:hypothetical protein
MIAETGKSAGMVPRLNKSVNTKRRAAMFCVRAIPVLRSACRRLPRAIDVLPVTDTDDEYQDFAVLDPIEDPKNSGSQTEYRRIALKRLHPARSRIPGETVDRLSHLFLGPSIELL